MSKFKVKNTGIEGLVILEPTVYGDSRGYFMETYNRKEFAELGLGMTFVQDNQSSSMKGVLRGLHYQVEHSQGKLVRVLSGEVFDVAVDLRPGSLTFGKWYGLFLNGENRLAFYVPEGFAHGFLVTSEKAEFAYKCTDFHYPEHERGISYNDPDIGIEWPMEGIGEPIMSDKDKRNGRLKDVL